jgi:cellulose biosynthesis protein BcsQ
MPPAPALTIQCPNCRVKLGVKGEARPDREVGCPKCKHRFFPFAVPADPEELRAEIPERPRPRVFVSHAHVDRAFVESILRSELEPYGIDIWISGTNLQGGERYSDEIQNALEAADWVILVLSPRSVASEWVQHEVRWALQHRPGRIIPILHEMCDAKDLNPALQGIQYIDFTTDDSTSITRIIHAMLLRTNEERRALKRQIEIQTNEIGLLELRRVSTQRRLDEVQGRISTALDFDGNWSEPQRGEVCPFEPLETRRTPIISVFNLKGGVGKSTLTANLGATLWGSAFKKRVLLIDLDYQGSLSRLCLDPSRIDRLRTCRDMSDRFLAKEPESDLLRLLAEPIADEEAEDRAKIIATDEELQIAESRSQFRWLLDPSAGSGDDIRYRLRSALHVPALSAKHDIVLCDCPPRLTTATINSLLASDYILVPTILDEISRESVPRVLKWLAVRRETLFPNLDLLGVVFNQARGTGREKEIKVELAASVKDAWHAKGRLFEAEIPRFTDAVLSHSFAARAKSVREKFEALAGQILNALPKLRKR